MTCRVWTAVFLLVVVTGCGAPQNPVQKLPLADSWRADIEYLSRELPRRHKNAFFKCTRVDFESAAAKLRDAIPTLANHEIVVGVLRLIAMVGDGHTQAQNYSQVGGFRSLPIMFEWLHDGYYVTRTTRSNASILGMRVTRIGKSPIDDAAQKLAELFAAENDMQMRRRVPFSLRCPEMLHACGLIDQIESAEFTFVDARGAESRTTLSPTPAGVELRWVHAAEIIPLAEQRPGEAYWYKILDTGHRGKAMYLAYNTCNDFGAFRKLAAELFRLIPTSQPIKPVPWRLIIDLRRNGGGNSMVIDAIYWHLAGRPDLREPGHILVLVGRGTFSSAMMNAVQLRNRYHAVLIGEPTGGSPNSYGEIKPLTLPHSRLTLMYSTQYFELQPGGAQTVTPDVFVEPTIEDVISGRDPVLEAALNYAPPRKSLGKAGGLSRFTLATIGGISLQWGCFHGEDGLLPRPPKGVGFMSRLFPRIICFTFAAIALVGCKKPDQPMPLANIEKDYDRQLPYGQFALKKIEPGQYPKFGDGWYKAKGTDLRQSIVNSIHYMNKPSSKKYFPLGPITHERALTSLQAFLITLDEASSPEALDELIRRDYDVYMSVGCDDVGTVLFTGYYSPIFDGSRDPSEKFNVPMYKLPADMKKDEEGNPVGGPWKTRQEIEQGGLLAGNEIAWLGDRFQAYVFTVQGSGFIRLPDNSLYEIGYAGHNGHDYTPIGRQMIKDGKIERFKLSLDTMIRYFQEHPDELDQYLYQNKRYVFFQESKGGPYGCLAERVTQYHSIATDKEIFPRGCLAFTDTRIPEKPGESMRTFRQFVLDQDRGAAIRAPGRTDIYMGVGDEAGKMAGFTYSEGRLYYLFLKEGMKPGQAVTQKNNGTDPNAAGGTGEEGTVIPTSEQTPAKKTK